MARPKGKQVEDDNTTYANILKSSDSSLAGTLLDIDSKLGSGADTKKVKVSANDTNEDYLFAKLESSDSSVSIEELNDGAAETVDLKISQNTIGTSAEQQDVLAQVVLTTTSPQTVYTAPVGKAVVIRSITFADTSGNTNVFTFFHDDAGGASYVDATSLVADLSLSGGSALVLDNLELFVQAGGQIGAQTNKANGMTVTVFGIVLDATAATTKVLYQGQLPTTAGTLYSPGVGLQAKIRNVFICNTGNNSADLDFYLDDDGGATPTYDSTTALRFGNTIGGKSAILLEERRIVIDENGNIGGKSSKANQLTVTIYGDEF